MMSKSYRFYGMGFINACKLATYQEDKIKNLVDLDPRISVIYEIMRYETRPDTLWKDIYRDQKYYAISPEGAESVIKDLEDKSLIKVTDTLNVTAYALDLIDQNKLSLGGYTYGSNSVSINLPHGDIFSFILDYYVSCDAHSGLDILYRDVRVI